MSDTIAKYIGASGYLRLVIAIGFAIAVSAPSGALAAPPDDAESKALFARAQAAYDGRDWETALELLRAAYALSPRVAFLFNIGQAQRQLGQCAAARESYAAYLSGLAGAGATEDARARVHAAMRELESCEEIEPAVSVSPLAAAEASQPIAPAPASPAPPPIRRDPPAEQPATSDVPAIVTWSLVASGAGALAAAGYFALDADSTASELERARSWDATLSERERDGREAALLAGILAGGGVGLLGVALAVHLAFSGDSPEPLAFVAGPDRAMAQYRSAF